MVCVLLLLCTLLYVMYGTSTPPSDNITVRMEDGSTYQLAARVKTPGGYNTTVVLLHPER